MDPWEQIFPFTVPCRLSVQPAACLPAFPAGRQPGPDTAVRPTHMQSCRCSRTHALHAGIGHLPCFAGSFQVPTEHVQYSTVLLKVSTETRRDSGKARGRGLTFAAARTAGDWRWRWRSGHTFPSFNAHSSVDPCGLEDKELLLLVPCPCPACPRFTPHLFMSISYY